MTLFTEVIGRNVTILVIALPSLIQTPRDGEFRSSLFFLHEVLPQHNSAFGDKKEGRGEEDRNSRHYDPGEEDRGSRAHSR